MPIPQRIAAIPGYISQEGLNDAAPGHRFQLYLKHWQNTTFAADKKIQAMDLKELCKLPPASKELLKNLQARQNTLIKHYEQDGWQVQARSTAAFATGLGYEHPTENGFAFLTPYGLPYLAGSGVKGIVRRAMQELRDDEEDGFTDVAIDALFGPECDAEDANNARRGALDFWDVFPAPKDDKLSVEIMTPHYGEYYQGKQTPHDAGTPKPITFLVVPAASEFNFYVRCHSTRLDADLQQQWKNLLDKAFAHAFEWVGFGAKKSVGYGAMEEDRSAKNKRDKELADLHAVQQKEQEKQQREQALQNMNPVEAAMAQWLDARSDKNQPELSALLAGLDKAPWSDAIRGEIAIHIQKLMQEAKKWKEKSEKKNPAKDSDYQDTLKVKKYLPS